MQVMLCYSSTEFLYLFETVIERMLCECGMEGTFRNIFLKEVFNYMDILTAMVLLTET